jgi:hypothetical protein
MLPLKDATEGSAGRLESSAPAAALAVSRVGASGVVDLLGGGGKGKIQDADGNSNLCFARTVFPTILDAVNPGQDKWIAVRVFAKPFGEDQLEHKGWVEGWKACQKGWASVEEMRRDMGI